MQFLAFCLLTVGTVLGVQQYIDGEFFIGLSNDADADAFIDLVKRDYNLELLKYFDMKTVKMVLVKGVASDVVRASKLPQAKYWDYNQIAYTQQCSEETVDGVWGLDRVDQRPAGLATPNTYNHGVNDGSGVTAYIVDSGIEITHPDYGNRAVWGFTAPGLNDGDGNGHGTHCAGTVGSNSYGVAQEVDLVAVKVLNAFGSGSTGDIVDGLDWVRTQHVSGAKSVINLSLGSSSGNNPMDDAIRALVTDGVSVVVAAGNSDADSCNSSPGRVAEAITVGASDDSDRSASFTNWGPCLDIFAPGVDILSTWLDGGTNTISGTSMACPHTVGAVARYMSSQSTAPTPAACESWVTSQATADALTFRAGHGTSPNLLLYVDEMCA